MHGLINRSIQLFISETYGASVWVKGAEKAGAPSDGFEAMLSYDDGATQKLLVVFSEMLDKPVETLLEDMGTFLISNQMFGPLRRLLRFGGENFVEFLHSLDGFQDRARLAIAGLDVPELELFDDGSGSFRLTCRWHLPGAGHLLIGVLRAMADDYGSLVLLDYTGWDMDGHDTIHIDLLDDGFASGREFHLAAALESGGR